jgi:hypothetical protein
MFLQEISPALIKQHHEVELLNSSFFMVDRSKHVRLLVYVPFERVQLATNSSSETVHDGPIYIYTMQAVIPRNRQEQISAAARICCVISYNDFACSPSQF